jgi:hypothetical protein
VIDLDDPPLQLVAGGVTQILVAAVAVGAVELRPALATPEFALAAWLVAAIASTIAYFATDARLANQRSGAVDGGALVSDERGQAAVTPIPLVLGVVAVITVLVGAKVDGGMGLDPLVGAGYAAAFLAVLWLFGAVPLRGGRSDF